MKIKLSDCKVEPRVWRAAAAMIRRAQAAGFRFRSAPAVLAERFDSSWKVRFTYQCKYGNAPMTAFLFIYEQFPPGMAIVPGALTEHGSSFHDAIAFFDWSRW